MEIMMIIFLKAFFKEFLQYEFVYFENLGVKLVRYYVW